MKNASVHSYTWPAGSPILRVEVGPDVNSTFQVRLEAAADAHGIDLPNLPRQLHKYGFSGAYADVHEGHNVLVVPHVKNPDRLMRALVANQLVAGEPEHQVTAAKEKEPVFNTLKWSGRIGLIGHAALMVNGVLQGEWGQVAAGPLGASTAGILANYGNGKSNLDFDTMLSKMDDYFAEEGLNIPRLDQPDQKKSIIESIVGAVSRHPIQIAYTVGSLGALALMQAGFKRYQQTKGKSGLGLLLAGTSSLAGNMAVLFVPEKRKTKEEREKAKHRTFGDWAASVPSSLGHLATHPTEIPGAAYNFIAESPLRFNGGLNFVDNISYFINAAGLHRAMQNWKKEHPGQIEMLKKELATLQHSPVTEETAKRVTELSGKKGLIAKLEKELKIANSPQGKVIPLVALTTALSFGCATFLSALSSKNQNGDESPDAAFEKLYALVAKVVVQLPPEKREQVLNRMAGYLSTRDDLRDSAISTKHLIEEVQKRVSVMENSPWIQNKASHAETVRQEAVTSQQRAYSV